MSVLLVEEPTNEQRYFDALRRIRAYMTPAQLRRAAKNIGLEYEEYLEMSYENVLAEAARAIKGKCPRIRSRAKATEPTPS